MYDGCNTSLWYHGKTCEYCKWPVNVFSLCCVSFKDMCMVWGGWMMWGGVVWCSVGLVGCWLGVGDVVVVRVWVGVWARIHLRMSVCVHTCSMYLLPHNVNDRHFKLRSWVRNMLYLICDLFLLFHIYLTISHWIHYLAILNNVIKGSEYIHRCRAPSQYKDHLSWYMDPLC